MEMVELQEKPWKIVNNKKKNQLMRRPWDALPSLALLNIVRNLNFKDRFGSFPLVCTTWNSLISNDPRCWSSMIPDSISPDDAFIKKPNYPFQVHPPSKLYDLKGREIVRDQGVSYLRNFINKSTCSLGGGGSSSSSTITSLFLDPFHFSNSDTNDSIHQNEILGLIARCCPNLKHISFYGFYCASREAVYEVIHSCKKIELIDFADSDYVDSVQDIEELVNCLPNLRGIRLTQWNNDPLLYLWNNYSLFDDIATHFPWIKLIDHDEGRSYYDDLNCEGCDDYRLRLRPNRPRLYSRHRPMCHMCWASVEIEEEKAYLEYLRDEEEDQYSILKVKKERRRYHQYVRVVLRTRRMRKKNKKQQQQQQEAASFMMKMKMRKKRDTYNYQDFYVRATTF